MKHEDMYEGPDDGPHWQTRSKPKTLAFCSLFVPFSYDCSENHLLLRCTHGLRGTQQASKLTAKRGSGIIVVRHISRVKF